jgi:hypothetical protein
LQDTEPHDESACTDIQTRWHALAQRSSELVTRPWDVAITFVALSIKHDQMHDTAYNRLVKDAGARVINASFAGDDICAAISCENCLHHCVLAAFVNSHLAFVIQEHDSNGWVSVEVPRVANTCADDIGQSTKVKNGYEFRCAADKEDVCVLFRGRSGHPITYQKCLNESTCCKRFFADVEALKAHIKARTLPSKAACTNASDDGAVDEMLLEGAGLSFTVNCARVHACCAPLLTVFLHDAARP